MPVYLLTAKTQWRPAGYYGSFLIVFSLLPQYPGQIQPGILPGSLHKNARTQATGRGHFKLTARKALSK